MSSISQIIRAITEHVDMVVHIGAGYCHEHQDYESLGIGRIYLIEADAQLYEKARVNFRASRTTCVIHSTVAGVEGESLFYRVNNRRFSSLREPQEILKAYPNLKVDSAETTALVSFEQLHERLDFSGTKNRLLVLELQGEECRLLSETNKNLLNDFKWIVIKADNESLYKHDYSSTTIGGLLKKLKYSAHRFDSDNALFEIFLGTRDDSLLALEKLELELQSAQGKQAELATMLERSTEENFQAKAAIKKFSTQAQSEKLRNKGHKKKRKKIKQQLQQLSEQHKELEAELTNRLDGIESLEAKIETVTTRHGDALHKIAELEGAKEENARLIVELERASTVYGDLLKSVDQLKIQLSDLTQTLAQREAHLSNTQEQLSRLNKENEELTKRVEETSSNLAISENESRETSHALRINNKLVAKTDADLRDLQQRYREAVESQGHQQTLLLELREKLAIASRFYRQLNLQDKNMAGDIFSDEEAVGEIIPPDTGK